MGSAMATSDTSKCSVSIVLGERWCSVLLIRVTMVDSIFAHVLQSQNCIHLASIRLSVLPYINI